VNLITLPFERPSPLIKQVHIANQVLEKLSASKNREVYEYLLIDHNDYITEGSKSNFFLVRDTCLYSAPEKDILNVLYVESRDINKSPYLFSIVKMKDNEVEVLYTIPTEISPRKRRMDVIRYLFNVLSLVADSYEVENKTLYQLVENSIKDLSDSVTMDYNKLYTAYDSMKKEVSDFKRKVNRLTEQVSALTTQNYDLKSHNDELRLRIKELESLSSDALKAKLQEWVVEHNGSINILEFSKVYKVSEARVEEMLNKLLSEGYLEVVQ